MPKLTLFNVFMFMALKFDPENVVGSPLADLVKPATVGCTLLTVQPM
jgi:hypothetical protein